MSGNSGRGSDRTEYGLRHRVPIAGFYGEDGPTVELGVIQTIPEGQVVLDDTPTCDEEYQRQARTGLSPTEAREVADALYEMAERVEGGDD